MAASRPTIHEVARVAGVAASTVSRALSNPDRVSIATRQHVELVAREVGYVPLRTSRRARETQRTNTVAIVVGDLTSPYFFDIVRGSQHQLRAGGFAQLLIDTEESGDLEADAIERVRASVDGVVLAASRLSDRAIAELGASVPTVVINRNVRGVPGVVIDTASGVEHALEHLASLGHREIAYVSGPERSWANELRWRTLEAASGRLAVRMSRIGPFAPNRSAGTTAADAALNAGVSAAIAYNDLMAIGMLARFADRGIRVPTDFSVVGCDDVYGADFCSPSLTTISSPVEQAGRAAVTLLAGLIENAASGPSRSGPGLRRDGILLPTHLTVRQSTATAPARAASAGGRFQDAVSRDVATSDSVSSDAVIPRGGHR